MTKLQQVDDLLKQRTLAALKQHDKVIRARVIAEAKKQGYNIGESDIQKIEFLQFVGLEQTVKPSFGTFASKEVQVPTFVDSADFRNNSAATISREVNYGESETREFNWSVTAGVTVSATVTEKVGVPGLSSEVSMNMQMSLSATAGQAWRDTKDWASKTTVNLPPYSSVHVQALLTRVVGDIPFTVKVVKDGRARCQVTLSYHGKRTRSFEVPLTQLLKPAERSFEASGKISGACGVNCQIDAQDQPLSADQRSALPPGLSVAAASLGTISL